MSYAIEKFLTFHGKNYPNGINQKIKVLPWVFVLNQSDNKTRVILESAITKGLQLTLGDTALIFSPSEAKSFLKKNIVPCAAIIELGQSEVLASNDGEMSTYNEIIPSVYVSELNETDESKKHFWKILKTLKALAL